MGVREKLRLNEFCLEFFIACSSIFAYSVMLGIRNVALFVAKCTPKDQILQEIQSLGLKALIIEA